MLYAIDFGAGTSLAIYGPDGPVKIRHKRVKGGKTQAGEFDATLQILLNGDEEQNIPYGDVVVESATIGSSGCEVGNVEKLLAHAKGSIFTIPTRLLKNWRKDNGMAAKTPNSHTEDAKLIFEISVAHPDRLHHWTSRPDQYVRKYTSVRPMDKRGYRDEQSEFFLSMLPEYGSLPNRLKQTFGDGEEYMRSRVIPLAMALDEPGMDTLAGNPRRRYAKIIGLCARGYPSFYRRATIDLMQRTAKRMSDVKKFAEVSFETRKRAWNRVSRDIRHLFHISYKGNAAS